MTNAQQTHPTPEQLAEYARGSLEVTIDQKIEAHLSECDTCCDTLNCLPEDTFVGILRDDRAVQVSQQTAAAASSPTADRKAGSHSLSLPHELGGYRIVELIGEGGMGAVYKAKHSMMQRTVALKLINPQLIKQPGAVERFEREVQAAARLSHPNIVTAHDAGHVGDLHFLAMEYVKGTDLADVVKENGKLPVEQACDYIRQAAFGLQHAHEQGMVHRDIKPHNLMVTNGQKSRETRDKSREQEGVGNSSGSQNSTLDSGLSSDSRLSVKILDFGLASLATEAVEGVEDLASDDEGASSGQLTLAGAMMGTPDFMSPEQANDARTADIRSDIYALGTTLYYLLAGHAPFPEGNVMQKLEAHRHQDAKPIDTVRTEVPAELADVIRRMMAKDPTERFKTPAEVADALAPFVDRNRSHVAPQADSSWHGGGGRVARRSIWHRVGVTAIVLFLLFAAAGGVYYIKTNNGTLQIRTNAADVEVIVRQNGEIVEIIDTKTDSHVIRLPTGKYEVELRGNNEFKISKDQFVLRRGEQVIVDVKHVAQQPWKRSKAEEKETIGQAVDDRPKPELAGLQYVTRDFMAAVVIHPQWILNKPIAQTAKLYLSDLFKRDLGIDMKDADQVVVLIPAKLPNQNRTATFEMAAIIRLPVVGIDSDGLLEKVDANTMVRQLLDRPERITDGPNVYYVGRRGSAAFVADNRTIVRAPRDLLVRMIGSTRPQGMLAEALAKADLNSDVVGVVANTGLARQSLFVGTAMARQQLRPDDAERLGRAPDSILSATVAMNLSPGAPISLTLNATNDEAAEMLARLSRVGLEETRRKLTELGATRVPSATITADELALRSAFELVGTATAVQQGDQVVVSTRTPSGLADAIMSSVIMRAKKSALDAQRRNQLKQLGLAMHNYHDVNKSFPPVERGLDNQFDKDGMPLLSWRVHILPFLGDEAAELYGEFRLNEPWNSEHNISLLDQMPSVFKTADSPTKTSMLAVVGPGAIYEGKRGVALKEVTDGTANTILVVLAGDDKAIPWTKPEDLPLVEDDPITAFGEINGDEFQAVFCDGSVQSLYKDLDPASLRNLLIRNDGNRIDRKKLRPKRPVLKPSEQGKTSASGTDAVSVSVVINVRADGTTDFEDRKLTLEELKSELKSLRTKTQLSVVISADRAAPVKAVRDVMTGLQSLGIRGVTVRNATPRRR